MVPCQHKSTRQAKERPLKNHENKLMKHLGERLRSFDNRSLAAKSLQLKSNHGTKLHHQIFGLLFLSIIRAVYADVDGLGYVLKLCFNVVMYEI